LNLWFLGSNLSPGLLWNIKFKTWVPFGDIIQNVGFTIYNSFFVVLVRKAKYSEVKFVIRICSSLKGCNCLELDEERDDNLLRLE